MTTPTQIALPPLHIEYAKLLAHSLARITNADAFVVNDDGHALLACADDIGDDGLHYWTPAQVVFKAERPS